MGWDTKMEEGFRDWMWDHKRRIRDRRNEEIREYLNMIPCYCLNSKP